MAENIAFKITVDTDVADLSVGELKQAFKDLTQELNQTTLGTEKYKNTLTKLGDVKGALKDVKEQIIALDPEKKFRAIANIGSTIASGFAAAQGAVALFGGESEDLQKVLVRVQAATALASGLQGLAGFGKALQTASLAMEAFALSNPFTAIAAAVVALVAVIYGMVQAFDDTTEKSDALRTSNEKLEESMKGLKEETALTEREMKALGATEQDIYAFREKARAREILTIQEEIENLNKLQRLGTITDEDLKKRNELEDRIATLRRVGKIEGLELSKKIAEEELDADIDLAKKQQELDKEEEARKKAAYEAEKKRILALEEFRKEVNYKIYLGDLERIKQQDADEKAKQDAGLAAMQAQEDARMAAEKKADEDAKKQKQLDKDVLEAKVALTAQTFGLIGDLALVFSGENEKGARRAFEINKAASIAQAVIATYQGANSIFASSAASPITVGFPAYPFIQAGLAVASGIANVAKIAKTQFQSRGAGDSGGSVSAPNLQSPQTSNNQAASFSERGVKANEQGNFAGFDKPMKAYVVESEMTNAQKTINSIAERTTF